ncbi:MAG: hypothetical protein AAF577_03585 [Pseudomonadota bacterium]
MGRWRQILGIFVVANLIAVPIAGRLAGQGMTALHGEGQTLLAVLLSVATTAIILVLNVLILRAAARHDMPRRLEAGLAAFTLVQFGVTIGFGIFSLVAFAAVLPSLLTWITS